MRVTFYTAVLVVAAGSVVLGLDWVAAPMPPMPEAKNIVFVPPPPPPPRVAAQVTLPETASPPAPQTTPAPVPRTAAAPSAPAPVQAPAPAAPAVVALPRVKCDIDACSAAYRSFRDSDCTYNPSFGPRRLCTKGDPERYAREHPEIAAPALAPAPETPPVAQTAEPGAIMAPSILAPEPGTTPATPAAPRCNVAACAAAYPRSFRELDCTYNPSSGPRKVCEK